MRRLRSWSGTPHKKSGFAMKLLSAAVVGFCFLSSAGLAVTPEGNWLSEDGTTKVHISTCGGNKL
jgi:hypothetical protein